MSFRTAMNFRGWHSFPARRAGAIGGERIGGAGAFFLRLVALPFASRWRRCLRFAGEILVLAAALALPSASASEEISWGAQADYCSRYLWHAIVYNDDPVADLEGWVSAAGFTLDAWGNYVANSAGPFQNRFDQTSLTLSRACTCGAVSLEPSFEYFFYPGQEDVPETGMLTVAISVPAGPVRLFTTHAFDMVQYPGAYIGAAGVSAAGTCGPASVDISVQVDGVSARFSSAYIGPSRDAVLYAAEGGISVTIPLAAGVFLKPHGEISSVIDSVLRAALSRPDATNIGCVVGWTFS